ncbi:hypothetical protein GGS23DRAFT_27514 [Durotheca rogersii]|uniref:uncharacterized protein n=1 Tax=Durotheca rogersii TaxID=419775 RepID=UPI00222111DF|nr:uncharacterized protein GGS23DRAFT_27514 [Durotheca rogersii]KAI5868390.1 hypothetical protein GGS23DRAFT_27514 [Durotheca rogersii]
MGHSRCFSTYDDDFEFDDAYFRQFYKPLSNLPTPPPSSRNSSAIQSPRIVAEDLDSTNGEYLGPAAHLARMLPPGASFVTPSIPMVQGILSRANLPMDIIALAVCILDSLNARFSRSWRISFPLAKSSELLTKRHTLPSGAAQAVHIDNVPPEIIILASLIVADKFVEDLQESTQYYCSSWGQNLWTCEQVNFTERLIMESLGYRILPLWEAKSIKQARHDIEMARRELLDSGVEMADENKLGKHSKAMSTGHAVMGFARQLTPSEAPKSELAQIQGRGHEAREAFSTCVASSRDYFSTTVSP